LAERGHNNALNKGLILGSEHPATNGGKWVITSAAGIIGTIAKHIASEGANGRYPESPFQEQSASNRPVPATQHRLNGRPLSGSRHQALSGELWVDAPLPH
jgi:hypothetical protein